jgi:hypothetical protein
LNNENKISILLPADRYKGAPELDNNLVFELDSKQKEVIEYDRNPNVFLDELYDSVCKGGVIILDDYGNFEGSRKATNFFFKSRNINPFYQPQYAHR